VSRPTPDARLDPYDYDLPEERIARFPLERRDGGRLLVAQEDGWGERPIRDLAGVCRPGDLLVLNDSRVLPARVVARRASGGLVEALLLAPTADHGPALVRPLRRLRPGEVLTPGRLTADGAFFPLDGASVRVGAREGDCVALELSPSVGAVLEAVGEMPIPPYFKRRADALDRERYQTVFAGPAGSVAAPTAGLHFTPGLLDNLRAQGVEVATLTLHVGAGTFLPLRPEQIDRQELHLERYIIGEELAAAIQRTRARRGRVIAVGTTSTRALESASDGAGGVRPGPGQTTLFIQEGFRFGVVDVLFTNLHLPRSSLLMLVCAFGGRARVMAGYAAALARGLRFYSYGDAMWVERARGEG
jgi:S-adenosylmethionine:tRNA ribosyltransferase-isomerase